MFVSGNQTSERFRMVKKHIIKISTILFILKDQLSKLSVISLKAHEDPMHDFIVEKKKTEKEQR